MGMQYETPDGKKMTEYFESLEALQKRKKVVERAGAKVTRVVCVYEGAKVHTNPKYPQPHQGAQEIERRRKRLEMQAKRVADSAA